MSDDLFLAVAVEAAQKGGEKLMAGFSQKVPFSEKSPRNFVTPLDAAAEAVILDVVRSNFPNHTVLAEESGLHQGNDEYRWIIDPLSSTRNYLHGMPHWAVCLALERRGVPIVAVALDPYYGELFTARAGLGAYRNGTLQQVSEVPSLERAMVCATFNVEGGECDEAISLGVGYFSRLARFADLRSLGSAALHLAFVAAGRLDAFVTNDADLFATIGGVLLVREAGGAVTDFQGKRWTPDSETLVASNGRFHDELLQVARGE